MSHIILDDDLKAKLNGLNEPVEVWDPKGRVMGQFVPQALYKKMFYAWLGTRFTDEEILAAKAALREMPGPHKSLDTLLREHGLR